MDILWLGVFALLLIGYFALEGFDIGVGMLLPVLGRTQRDRDEIVAAKPTAAYDAKFGAFVIDPGFFTRLVYEGV